MDEAEEVSDWMVAEAIDKQSSFLPVKKGSWHLRKRRFLVRVVSEGLRT